MRGEVISGPGNFEIEVLDADPRRVKRLRIGIRKERPVVRPRETRRREAASDSGAIAGAAADHVRAFASGDGASSS